jgi:formamidopyrimidine-DNA glycosylase
VPELPDVEVFRRRLAATGLHRRVDRVVVHDASLPREVSRQHLQEAITGHELKRTRRHGKHLFAAVSGGEWLVLHFGMTGLLDYHRNGEPDDDHTRLTLRFEDGSRVAYIDQRRLGFVTLTSDVDAYVEEEPLGPDALELSPKALRDLLRDRRGAVKSVLMDQAVIAGIGNIYSDEILFHARVDPRTPARSLDDAVCRRIHRQVGRVLRMAADRSVDVNRMPRGWLLPHRGDGAPCPRGNGEVRRFKLSGRGAYYCPACQEG